MVRRSLSPVVGPAAAVAGSHPQSLYPRHRLCPAWPLAYGQRRRTGSSISALFLPLVGGPARNDHEAFPSPRPLTFFASLVPTHADSGSAPTRRRAIDGPGSELL